MITSMSTRINLTDLEFVLKKKIFTLTILGILTLGKINLYRNWAKNKKVI